jgi:hypothetical protein
MTALPMTLRDDRFAERHQSQIVITTCRVIREAVITTCCVILRGRSSQRVVSSFEEGHPLCDLFINGLVASGWYVYIY